MKFTAFLILGLVIGSSLTYIFVGGSDNSAGTDSGEKEPLYWVAPMDANYRRDKPGQSPMGMDLIPVYEEDTTANGAGPGTITINSSVINNLGVRTAIAEKKALQEEISTVGYVQYDEKQLVHIHPRVSGWIDTLYVKATGDPVKKGAPLYALYSPELVNAQEELILALNTSQNSVNSRLIKAAEDRLRALQIPPAFIQRLKQTKTIQQNVTFYSPQDGVVDNLNVREGFYVQPGTTLFSIGNLDRVWVEAEVFERQSALVKKGAKVTMTLDYLPGKIWHGQVDYIYPTLDSTTRTVRLRLEFDNPDNQLLPNMFAQVVIYSESDPSTLLIPREGLIRTGEQDRVVLALGEGSFKSVAVEAGREDQHYVEILNGLKEGESIVSSAQFLIDSESSKTSDFKRMHSKENLPDSVWVAAVIEDRLPDQRVVTVRHDAIAEWSMAAMTMNFSIAETINIESLTPGTELHMQITMGDSGLYEIIGVHIMSPGSDKAQSEASTDASADSVKGE